MKQTPAVYCDCGQHVFDVLGGQWLRVTPRGTSRVGPRWSFINGWWRRSTIVPVKPCPGCNTSLSSPPHQDRIDAALRAHGMKQPVAPAERSE